MTIAKRTPVNPTLRRATSFLADYAADRPEVLADLLMDADVKKFAVVYPRFKQQAERGLPDLLAEIDRILRSGG
jgi:hypothetical protein